MTDFSVPEDIQELSRQRALNFYKRFRVPTPVRLEAGQIWSTQARLELSGGQRFITETPLLVVILDASETLASGRLLISCAPLSMDLEMATSNDLIVTGEHSPLGFDFLIEAWNETPVLREHLRHFLGKLDAGAAAALHSLYLAQLLDSSLPEGLESWVGLPVQNGTDLRLDFQKDQVAAARYLADAAMAALAEPLTTPLVEQPEGSAPTRILELSPILTKLSRVIKRPVVAAAASANGEADTYVVQQPGVIEGFTLEVLFRSRPPYQIYLKVHELSPDLVGRQASVTVTATTGRWEGPSVSLEAGGNIPVAHDAGFQIHQVQTVIVHLL